MHLHLCWPLVLILNIDHNPSSSSSSASGQLSFTHMPYFPCPRTFSCIYSNRNITIKIEGSSTTPYYLAFKMILQLFGCVRLGTLFASCWIVLMAQREQRHLHPVTTFFEDAIQQRWETETCVVPVNNIPQDRSSSKGAEAGDYFFVEA